MQMRKLLSLLLLSFLLVLPVAAVKQRPAKVIIVAGQSNTMAECQAMSLICTSETYLTVIGGGAVEKKSEPKVNSNSLIPLTRRNAGS